MAVATKVRNASAREFKILEWLVMYHKGECSLGWEAKKLDMPIRALMELMMRNKLPQYWQEEDGGKGLARLSELRSAS